MILTECGKWASRLRRLAVPGQQWGLNVVGAKFEVSSTFEKAKELPSLELQQHLNYKPSLNEAYPLPLRFLKKQCVSRVEKKYFFSCAVAMHFSLKTPCRRRH